MRIVLRDLPVHAKPVVVELLLRHLRSPFEEHQAAHRLAGLEIVGLGGHGLLLLEPHAPAAEQVRSSTVVSQLMTISSRRPPTSVLESNPVGPSSCVSFHSSLCIAASYASRLSNQCSAWPSNAGSELGSSSCVLWSRAEAQ